MSAELLTLLEGDCLAGLRTRAPKSAKCCVTSPPYFGLRDYGVGGQIGLEATPADYVAKMVEVFEEVRRVLTDDGTLWLNLGDSYAGSGRGPDTGSSTLEGGRQSQAECRKGAQAHLQSRAVAAGAIDRKCVKPPAGLKNKDLIGIPWRVAFALQAAGWWLRSDIIWHKPNPMPESITDRPTKAHEYIFLLTKSANYYYNAEAIQERVSGGAHHRGHGVNPKAKVEGRNSGMNRDRDPAHQTASKIRSKQNRSFSSAVRGLVDFRNKRSVWTVGSQPYSGAHFATFPPDLIKPCILAGTRPGDVVLDPFGGSGTTGAVALELGRRALLIELNPKYCDLIRQRCQVTVGLPLE